MSVLPPPEAVDLEVPVLIIGAGACGMVAALAAQEAGTEPLVLEADPVPSGSTALSAGLIPAAGTRLQAEAGIADDPARFAADIQAKAKGENPQALVDLLAREAAPAVDWLCDLGLPFSVVDDFDYPGHSRHRMHGLPSRAGRELIDRLRSLCEARGIDIVCDRRAVALYAEAGRVTGAEIAAPEGTERIGAQTVVLACNGYGGNREMVAAEMPAIADAIWFGHDGNRGDAVTWGRALGARVRHLGAYQGHGNVAHPHGILITWATITEGGVQVNTRGERFWDESQGYSEAARAVLAQPGGVAWTIFDARIAGVARQFEDFRAAEAAGAVREAEDIAALAATCDLPEDRLAAELSALSGTDRFGRRFRRAGLTPPYRAVKVTGALFHTQGGLEVDDAARVVGADGPIPGLFAAGGAALGVSGKGDSGYLSGNGLLSAVALGRVAGRAAAADATR
ncbi:FAD-dependent oxidoreductase [Jannaschia seohaensis]|uniref:Fumarate reductase flavoprotein subunit n=1 Tax=Jannaschia seohaensis TaxID=475081 RepID=A0A2Y9AY37_9RHOB|nr:FAD-dependent oxidoreductase [Jannaschia seohaensis]PWJ16201.1 fumarate reductase flavoprotein subunit [Jannaschia seohaensis]SSA49224.1 fumarate reductase flavoprotein subunit [Jannaschia seohaensis]